MTTTTAATNLQPLSGYQPESAGGVRLFREVRARGRDVIEWAEQNPGALNSSLWENCDLDDTEWPAEIQDLTIVDSTLRNSVWRLKDGNNIRIMGTKRISMHLDPQTEDLVADVSQVAARVDGMRLTGRVTGLSMLRVAGKDVTFGEPEPGFFAQTKLPIKYGGNPARIDTSSVQFSYIDELVVYLDAEDVTFYKNGLPNFRFGGRSRRCDISWNLAPDMVGTGDHDSLNAQKLRARGGTFAGVFYRLAGQEGDFRASTFHGNFARANFSDTFGFRVKEVHPADTTNADMRDVTLGINDTKQGVQRKSRRRIAASATAVEMDGGPVVVSTTVGREVKVTVDRGLG